MKTRLLILLTVFFLSINLYSQEKKINPNDLKKMILLTNKTNSKKVKFLKDNKRIVYKLQADDKKHKGKMQIINDTIIAIDGKEILLSKLTMIGGRSTGLKAAKVLGGIVVASGVTLSTIGVIMIIQSQNKTDCEGALGQIIGTIMFAGGAIVTILGGIPLAIKPKHFNLEKTWDAKVAYEQK